MWENTHVRGPSGMPWAEFSYNTSPHLYQNGPIQGPLWKISSQCGAGEHGTSPVESLEAMLQERDAILDALHMNLVKAQQ